MNKFKGCEIINKTDNNNSDVLSFKLNVSDKKEFQAICSKKNIKASELLRQYVLACNKAGKPLIFL